MKLRHLAIAFLTLATIFSACDPEKDNKDQVHGIESPSVTVSPSSVSITSAGGAEDVTITTNCNWTASSDADWLEISVKSGGTSKSGATVSVSAGANKGEPRQGIITITGTIGTETATATISVSQAAPNPTLFLSTGTLSVSLKGGELSLKLKATGDWTSSCNVDWITVTPSGDEGSEDNQTIRVKVNENTGSDRSGKVTFTMGTKTTTLTVNQNGRAEAEDVTVAEFTSRPAGTEKWYRITGEITQICDYLSEKAYGNFYIKDSTGELFVYGLTTEKSGTNDQSFSKLGLQEGDILTFVTLRSEYRGKPQGGGNTTPAFYESHEKGTTVYRTYSDFKAAKATAGWMELPETSESDGYDFLHHTMWLGSREVRSYSLYWDYANKVSRWVAYPLNVELLGYRKGRTNKWGFDPLLSKDEQPDVNGAYSEDAEGIAYGRGHQIASADRTNYEANTRVFFGTNMTPQISDFNGAIWKNLEETVRVWSQRSTTDTLYVVTGCVVDDSVKSVTSANGLRVTVPTGYYKALLRLYEGRYNAVGFYFDHKKYPVNKIDRTMAISIDALEEKVGENFFVNLPDDIEAAVESADPAADNWWWDKMGDD